ncbi:MAG: nitroreductase family protein, partial [Bacteroidales bacterium]
MKNISQKLNLLLAVSLILLSAKIVFLDSSNKSSKATNNSAMEVILSRRSIRSFTAQTVEQDKVEQLLRAAMSAPTARNMQPWAFIVITDRATLDSLAKLSNAKMLSSAPMAIVACGDMSKAIKENGTDFWIQDVSAVTQNILLAAHALGLGAVWTGIYPLEDRVSFVRTHLALPSNVIPLSVIPVGYPNG